MFTSEKLWTFLLRTIPMLVALIDYGEGKASIFLLEQRCYTPQNWPTLWPSMDHINSFLIPDSKIITVKGTLRVQLSRNPLEFRALDRYACKVAFVASSPNHRLLLSWQFFTIGESQNGEDWLNVLDQGSDLELSGRMWGAQGQALMGRRPPPTTDYHSLSTGFSLAYKGHPYYDAFTIILTEFQDVLQPSRLCPEGLFACSPGYPLCINVELVCNSIDNCGTESNSDEDPDICVTPATRLSSKSGTPVGLIGALCGIVVTALLVATVSTTVYFYKRHRSHSDQQQHLRSSKPHGIDTLAEINAYKPKSQNIYNTPPGMVAKGSPKLHSITIGRVDPMQRPTNDSSEDITSYNQSQILNHRQRMNNPYVSTDQDRNPYEAIANLNSLPSTATRGPRLLPGANTDNDNEVTLLWPNHNGAYYNDMGEETPLYQEI